MSALKLPSIKTTLGFSLPQSGSWDAEGATCQPCVGGLVPPHSAGHNLHVLNSVRQLQAPCTVCSEPTGGVHCGIIFPLILPTALRF